MERVYVYRHLWALCKCEAEEFKKVDMTCSKQIFTQVRQKMSVLSLAAPVMS